MPKLKLTGGTGPNPQYRYADDPQRLQLFSFFAELTHTCTDRSLLPKRIFLILQNLTMSLDNYFASLLQDNAAMNVVIVRDDALTKSTKRISTRSPSSRAIRNREQSINRFRPHDSELHSTPPKCPVRKPSTVSEPTFA
jgi:hypothetical protein